jgi:hypothetical protein
MVVKIIYYIPDGGFISTIGMYFVAVSFMGGIHYIKMKRFSIKRFTNSSDFRHILHRVLNF